MEVLPGVYSLPGHGPPMVARIYPELDDCLKKISLGQMKAHLVKLEREGRAVGKGRGEKRRYRLTE